MFQDLQYLNTVGLFPGLFPILDSSFCTASNPEVFSGVRVRSGGGAWCAGCHVCADRLRALQVLVPAATVLVLAAFVAAGMVVALELLHEVLLLLTA